MAYRLIFTSSKRALSGSRTGFCTVARSKSMSEKLANIVERCGTYDSDKMAGAPIFSHRIVSFANTSYHVLTRVSDAGADYTNRSNYLAEHIVLSPEECALLATPAQFLLDKKDWIASWDEEPRFLEDLEIKKAQARFEPPSKNWEKLFGDASKAALLLEPNPVIFASPKDAQTLLELYAESASLLPQKIKSWDYTFTTAIQRGENPSDFNWKAEINPTLDKLKANPSAVNLISKTAPDAPISAAAKYAKTASMSNRDRFGLKVASAQDMKPKIYIAKVEKKRVDGKLIAIISASVIVTIAALAVALVALGGGNEGSSSFNPAQVYEDFDSSKASAPETARQTYEKLRAKISTKIEAKQWKQALELWDKSIVKGYNPDAREQILGQIARNLDLLMDEAQELLKNPQKDSDEPRAVSLMHSVADALEISDIPERQERLNRWKNIEKEIKKL